MKQLTCAVAQDDFEDKEKTTRQPISMSTASEESYVNSKTTKASIWTSNTIDVDYGMPTRHRRETEDTLSPVTTKSTISNLLLKAQKVTATSDSYTGKITNNYINLPQILQKKF